MKSPNGIIAKSISAFLKPSVELDRKKLVINQIQKKNQQDKAGTSKPEGMDCFKIKKLEQTPEIRSYKLKVADLISEIARHIKNSRS